MDTKGNRVLAPVFRFNLFDICELLDTLFPILDGLATNAHETLLAVYEELAEARQFELENADYERD